MPSKLNNISIVVLAKSLIVFIAIAAIVSFSFDRPAGGQGAAQNKQLDPKAWGGNHAGKAIPDYMHGDECLFCHRYTIGVTWQQNSHALTVQQREDSPKLTGILESQPALASISKEVEYFLGSRHRVRFLQKEGYGRFNILDAQAVLGESGGVRVIGTDKFVWDKAKFADRCAGCHATAVDSGTRAFSAFGLDCYVCHGEVDPNHSNDTSLVLLSKKRRNNAQVITSICAQCHLRETRSRSTGLPYPNNFVAGDNLFQDLDVDWKRADDEKMNAGDRHVWRNTRDVVINGNDSITCINCHQVHGSSSLRHRRILRAPICSECHEAEGFKNVRKYSVHSGLCEY